MRKNYNRFDNLKFSIAPRLNFREKTTQIYERSILSEQRFYYFFRVETKNKEVSSAFKKAHKYNALMIKKELERVRCQL